ncbi:MAG: CoA ester lyase [Spirochaetales bacterium]|nr:CoA ester lyase [Spirochaetales bacterium]
MRSWLYIPGNSPKMIVQSGIYGADGIVLDLEDSVSSDKKDEARILVSEAVKDLDLSGAAVRINGFDTPWWKTDLLAVVSAGICRIRIPKVETSETVEKIALKIDLLEERLGMTPGSVKIQCILETPLGIENAFSIGKSSNRIEALSFGAEDYCTQLGISRRGGAFVLDYPRSRIVNAAGAIGLQAIDTVWADFKDPDGLEADAFRAKQLGFSGKSVIHPDQIEIVNRIFTVSEEEIAWAIKVLEKVRGGEEGAFSLDGSMVDLPVVKRAEGILKRAGNK